MLAHLQNIEAKYSTTSFLKPFQFGVLGVDLFFVISGVVISAVTVGRFSSASNAGRFLYHRLARIFPVYWLYTAVVLAAYLYNPMWMSASSSHQVDILGSFLLVPRGLPLLIMQGWTLSYEIYFYLVFTVLLFLSERTARWLMALWAVILMAVPLLGGGGLVFNPISLEFLAGCVLFRLYRRSRLHPGIGVGLICVALAWLGAIMMWTSLHHAADQHWIESSTWLRPALYGSFSTLFLFGMMELERTQLIRYSTLLEQIGDWSYSIYLSHLILLEFVARLIFRYCPQASWTMPAVACVSLPLVIVVGRLSYTYLELPLMRWLYRYAPAARAGTS